MGAVVISSEEETGLVEKYRQEFQKYVVDLGGIAASVDKFSISVKKFLRMERHRSNSNVKKPRTRVSVEYRVSSDDGDCVFRTRVDAAKYLGLLTETTSLPQSSTGSKKRNREARHVEKEKNNTTLPKIYPNSLSMASWQNELLDSSPLALCKRVRQFLNDGFSIFRNVFPESYIQRALYGEDDSEILALFAAEEFGLRVRKGNQRWMGAVKTINACIKVDGTTETVLSPLTTRGWGRFDMPLPKPVCTEFEKCLEQAGVFKLVNFLLNGKGRIRTQDIMLAKPGATEQQAHTDSSWIGKGKKNPKLHYITVIIPLTQQTPQTGGTRVWPGSHRYHEFDWSNFVDMVEPTLNKGDALVFDGLLTHLGMANNSETSDRYFYYAALAKGHDRNTDVTGF